MCTSEVPIRIVYKPSFKLASQAITPLGLHHSFSHTRSLGTKPGRQNRVESDVIPLGNHNPLVAVVDVELLAQGNPDDTARLGECLRDRDRTTIIYTSGTRSLNAIRVSESVLQLPPADAVICDAGASVDSRTEHPEIAELDKTLASKWIGTDVVRKRLRNICHLVGEHSYESARRFSCFPYKGVSVSDAKAAIDKECVGIDLDVSIAAGDRIDISPPGVDTASTLMRLLDIINAHPMWTVVAGHLLGEGLIAKAGCWGIVTGEIKPSVKASLVHYPRVHFTDAEGPSGIRIGLEEFGLL